MNNNKRLFWYGFWAKVMKRGGIFLMLVFLFVAFFETTVGIIGMVLSIALIIKGSANEYDYKRRGGYIVYHD